MIKAANTITGTALLTIAFSMIKETEYSAPCFIAGMALLAISSVLYFCKLRKTYVDKKHKKD